METSFNSQVWNLESFRCRILRMPRNESDIVHILKEVPSTSRGLPVASDAFSYSPVEYHDMVMRPEESEESSSYSGDPSAVSQC
jgi:hypothetical protein